jgi:dihydroorotase
MLNHVHDGRLSLNRFVEMVTMNPVRVFGILNKGFLREGYDADITIVDLKAERTIDNSWIASKCGWTPFHGMKVTGWMTHTIVGGNLVMENDTVLMPAQGKPVNFKDTKH